MADGETRVSIQGTRKNWWFVTELLKNIYSKVVTGSTRSVRGKLDIGTG